MPEWRNWQTRGIQNPVAFTGRAGSTPAFGTNPVSVAIARRYASEITTAEKSFWNCASVTCTRPSLGLESVPLPSKPHGL